MSEKNSKIVIRFFGAWNDRKEENWLRGLALKGWHLESIAVVFYKFRRGEPADYTYRLDFQSSGKFDRREYLGLFRDAGWDFVGRNGAWYYFRTPTGKGAVPEIHTDTPSRVAKYRRLLLLLVLFMVVLFNNTFNIIGSRAYSGFWIVIQVIQGAIFLFMIYAVIRLALLISKLKKETIGREG